jgi:acid stress-induced BolA-like protein IbaG/YrbA
MQTDEVKRIIEENLPGSFAQVSDMTGTGDHFDAVVVAPQFEGKSLVQQHQIVYRALGTLVDGRTIHALALKTHTPAQWQGRAPSFGRKEEDR